MIYSVSKHKEIPVTVTKKLHYIDDGLDDVTRYDVYTASKKANHIGFLKLMDTKNGVKVLYIKNENHDHYRHFALVADQIEVEHCIKRGIKNPFIESVAAIGTHIQHYKRGKRFMNDGLNIYFDSVLKNLSKGERIITGFLGVQKMYMPANLINEIKNKIQINPILKGIK